MQTHEGRASNRSDLSLFCILPSAFCISSCGDFRLKPQHIPIFHAYIPQALIIKQLLAAGAMVEFVAEDLPVGGVLREIHLLEQHRQNAVYRRIIRHIHLLPLIAGRIPNMNADYCHLRRSSILFKTAQLMRLNARNR